MTHDETIKMRGINKKALRKLHNENTREQTSETELEIASTQVAQEHIEDADQNRAVEMVLNNQYCSIIGSAGTGKTHVLIKAVQALLKRKEYQEFIDYNDAFIAPIAFVSFTNKAVNVISQRLSPYGLAGNCTTIHKLLAYSQVTIPVRYNPDGTVASCSRVYKPRIGYQKYLACDGINSSEYTERSNLKLPFKAIFIDEAGNISDELWHNLLAAVTPDCKIIMLGDLAQLPPILGVSPLAYNLAVNPSVELLKIYRQKDGNDIPLLAQDIRMGKVPDFSKYKNGKFLNTQVYEPEYFANQLRPTEDEVISLACVVMKTCYNQGLYDPLQDTITIATRKSKNEINNFLMDLVNPPLYNKRKQRLNPVITLKPCNKNYMVGSKIIVDSDEKQTSIEATDGSLITKGTVGIIKKIRPNPAYFSQEEYKIKMEEALQLEASFDEDDTDGSVDEVDIFEDFNIEDLERAKEDAIADSEGYLAEQYDNQISFIKEKREEVESRSINYILYLKFEDGKEAEIRTLKDLNCIQLGYAMTVHKTQGSQYRNIFHFVSQAANMQIIQNNEALYTAVTRATNMAYIISNRKSLVKSIGLRAIYGTNGYEKSVKMLEKDNQIKVVINEEISHNMPLELFNNIKHKITNHIVDKDQILENNFNLLISEDFNKIKSRKTLHDKEIDELQEGIENVF